MANGRTLRWTVTATLCGALLSTKGFAQQARGFLVDRFDPSERGSEWFSLDSLDFRGHGRPAVGIVGDFAYRPLVLYNLDGSPAASLIKSQYVLHPGVSLILWDRLRIGLNVPIAVFESGRAEVIRAVSYAAPSGTPLGDVRLSGDVQLVGAYGDPFTLGFGVAIFFPSGSRAAYMGDGSLRLSPRLAAAGTVGAFTYAARASFEYRALDESFGGSGLGSELLFGASAGLRTDDGRFILGPEVMASTVVTANDGAFATRNSPVEILLGGHAIVALDWRLGAGVGSGFSRGYGSPQARALLSIEWAPGYSPPPRPDRDHDGVPDVEDACSDAPGVRTNDRRTTGCPAPLPPSDRDNDGVIDDEDACPDVRGIKTNDPRSNGCAPDRDQDGIVDSADACPDVQGTKTGDPTTNGCPADRDADGVPDALDVCPDLPGKRTDDPTTNGCPGDRDKDGILDTDDACPDAAGPKNVDPRKHGCPLAVVQLGQIRILEPITFHTGTADLDPMSNPVLAAVAHLMNADPQVKRVRVEGHTDNQGSPAFNLTLSKARARSVARWLVERGVDEKRLESQGHGMARPIQTNATAEGRQANRRVEVHLVEGER